MRYEEDLIEEIREKNDIVDVISSYVSLKKKGSSYFGLCPFHNEKTGSFSVSREKQMYYCFGCHAGGNVITFMMEYNKLTFTEAMEELAGRAGVALPEREQTPEERRRRDRREILKEMNRAAAVYFHALLRSRRGQNAYAYLKDRGISDEMINHFGLGYADIYRDDLYRYLKSKGFHDRDLKDSSLVTIDTDRGSYDRFFNRIMFPIMDVGQRVIGFGGRVMGDGEPKYLNSRETPLFDKGRNLYGLQYARRTREKEIILCEGYMDVISLHQAGFTNAVAPLGTAFTEGQAMLLKRYTRDVVLSFDSDPAGVNAALRALPILREAGLNGRVLTMKGAKDPDELIKKSGEEAYRACLKEAVSGRMFELIALEKDYNQSDPADRTRFLNAAAGKLAEIEEPVERDVYIDAAASRFMIKRQDLADLVNRIGSRLEQEKANDQYRRQPRTQERVRKKKESNRNQPQRLLLSWIADRPDVYEAVEDYVGPEDFQNPLYHAVALLLFEQIESGETVNPARIISCFPDAAQQSMAAEVFHSRLDYSPAREDQDKALTEVVKKVRLQSIEAQLASTTDMMKMQDLLQQRQEVQNLKISRPN